MVVGTREPSIEEVLTFGRKLARVLGYAALAGVAHEKEEDIREEWLTDDGKCPIGLESEECERAVLQKFDELTKQAESLLFQEEVFPERISPLLGAVQRGNYSIAVGGACEEQDRLLAAMVAWWCTDECRIHDSLEEVQLASERSAWILHVITKSFVPFERFMVDQCAIPPLPFFQNGKQMDGYFVRTNDSERPVVGIAVHPLV